MFTHAIKIPVHDPLFMLGNNSQYCAGTQESESEIEFNTRHSMVVRIFIDTKPEENDFSIKELKQYLKSYGYLCEDQLKFNGYNLKHREKSLLECDVVILPFNTNTLNVWLANCLRGYRKFQIKRQNSFHIIIYTSEDRYFPNLNNFVDLPIEICSSPENCIAKVQNYANL